MEKNLRYRTGYMKDRGGSCAGCRQYMPTDTLFLAVMLQSRKEDDKYAIHYHVKCFFKNQRLNTPADVAGFEKLRVKDQNEITAKIDKYNTAIIAKPSKKEAKKNAPKRTVNEPIKMSKQALRDFGVEYSKSGRAQCCGCRQKIPKYVVRCKKLVYNTEVGLNFGGQPLWHHFDCFVKLKIDLGWFGSGDQLPGFELLREEDQQMIIKELSSIKLDEIPDAKKPKLTSKQQTEKKEFDMKREEQNKIFFDFRDTLKGSVSKSNWTKILKKNKQQVPQKNDDILDACADILAFGGIRPCSICKGQLVLDKFGYVCSGSIDEWTKCDNFQRDPKRVIGLLPKELSKYFPNYIGHTEKRLFSFELPTTSTVRKFQPVNHTYDVKVQREKPPLYQLEVATIGSTIRSKIELKETVEKLGGKLITRIHGRLFAIISNETEVKRMTKRMKTAQEYGIQIVTEDFVDKIQTCNAIEYLKENSICDWGTDPELRIPQDEIGGSKIKSIYTLSVPKSVKLKVVDGAAVDPASGLQSHTHVYTEGSIKYTSALSLTDIQNDKNSYFKIQLLEANMKNSYWVFSTWGRIGTNIGDNEINQFYDVGSAKCRFFALYYEKTGNQFGAKNFEKKPGKYVVIDVDYSEKEIKKITDHAEIPSKLVLPVQNLMKMIFDVELMKKAMVEFDLDMQKMPLGKLSQKQLVEALGVLMKISKLIEQGGSNVMFVGASNHFYTIIPHDFGIQCPPIIDTIEMVNSKTEMIDMLLQLEIAFNLLQSDTNSAVSPLDNHYQQLKTDIQPLDVDSEEYSFIQKYLENTHADTHSYKLEIEDIFKIKRDGEEKRYEPFKTLPNRKLLWHGSRLTNFVGILSNGLKIAPPQAPASGYMFGKGIYFADMVTKSANYCFSATDGLLLLCEVALGNMLELTAARSITNLPKNKHSTKGIGKTYPLNSESQFLDNGVEVPLGRSVTDLSVNSGLLYNEYIVYDVGQVNLKYLLKVKFNTRK